MGLSTAPVLYACEYNESEMVPLMARRFSKNGDVEKAFDIIINKRLVFLVYKSPSALLNIYQTFQKRKNIKNNEIWVLEPSLIQAKAALKLTFYEYK